MKVKDLKNLLSNVDDDFDIDIMLITDVPPPQLQVMYYAYPYNYTHFKPEFGDIGYSDKVFRLDIK